jgi:hypothetical protein
MNALAALGRRLLRWLRRGHGAGIATHGRDEPGRAGDDARARFWRELREGQREAELNVERR